MTNTPEIISGEYADPFPDVNPIRDDGTVNWGAAMWADPGIKKCDECGTPYWNLARVMRCPKCKTIFGEDEDDDFVLGEIK